jgi:hypothetical protein
LEFRASFITTLSNRKQNYLSEVNTRLSATCISLKETV